MQYRSRFEITNSIASAVALCLSACSTDKTVVPGAIVPPSSAAIMSPPVWGSLGGVTITGGFGSGLSVDPNDASIFYLLTDRGANVATTVAGQLLFPVPSFNPQIGKFRLVGDSLRLIATIGLKTAAGVPLTGIPNPAGVGGTGETAVGPGNAPIPFDPDGVDSEGLALASDGTFWVSDEYGPHILHVDGSGRTIERINPFGSGTGGRKIPLVLSRRRPNRGMEGLAITPDGKTLVGIMQSPLDNPTAALGRLSNANRIVTFDIASGAAHEYVYETEVVGNHASDITAVSGTVMLVDERDGSFAGGSPPAAYKRIYRIDLSGATDVTDAANAVTGKLFTGFTLEALSPAQRSQNGIVPVSKSLLYDLLTLAGGYPHDKVEGLALINGSTLVVSNDDDFGVVDNGSGGLAPKLLPLTGKTDRMILYFIKLGQTVK